MPMASSTAIPDRDGGTAHPRAFPAAAAGKPRASKASRTADGFTAVRRLLIAVATLFVTAVSATAGHAQAGPFAGMAGIWPGGGTVTLDDGSTERIRCRETAAVGDRGAGLNLSLACASDSYKFDLSGNFISH